jgi:carotenoid cleavage dioxygenase-like enzyme
MFESDLPFQIRVDR